MEFYNKIFRLGARKQKKGVKSVQSTGVGLEGLISFLLI